MTRRDVLLGLAIIIFAASWGIAYLIPVQVCRYGYPACYHVMLGKPLPDAAAIDQFWILRIIVLVVGMSIAATLLMLSLPKSFPRLTDDSRSG